MPAEFIGDLSLAMSPPERREATIEALRWERHGYEQRLRLMAQAAQGAHTGRQGEARAMGVDDLSADQLTGRVAQVDAELRRLGVKHPTSRTSPPGDPGHPVAPVATGGVA